MQTSTPVNQASTQPNFTPSPAQPVNSAPPLTPIQQMGAPPANLTPFHPGVPITSPLPSAAMSPAAMALPPAILDSHDSVTADDDALPPEFLRRRDAWIASSTTLRLIDAARSASTGSALHPDRSMLTSPAIHFRDVLQVSASESLQP